MLHIKLADDWIRTADCWCCKPPLHQLSHNHWPDNKDLVFLELMFEFYERIYSTKNSSCRTLDEGQAPVFIGTSSWTVWGRWQRRSWPWWWWLWVRSCNGWSRAWNSRIWWGLASWWAGGNRWTHCASRPRSRNGSERCTGSRRSSLGKCPRL